MILSYLTVRIGIINASAIASANEVFPFPGGPINSSLFLGFIPYDCNKSARFCSLIKSWQADRT